MLNLSDLLFETTAEIIETKLDDERYAEMRMDILLLLREMRIVQAMADSPSPITTQSRMDIISRLQDHCSTWKFIESEITATRVQI